MIYCIKVIHYIPILKVGYLLCIIHPSIPIAFHLLLSSFYYPLGMVQMNLTGSNQQKGPALRGDCSNGQELFFTLNLALVRSHSYVR